MGDQYKYHMQQQQDYGPTSVFMPYQYYNYPQQNRQLPFLATLDLLELSKLINDPIMHDHFFPPIPTKLALDLPKFDGKHGKEPKNHVMTFHLWFSLNLFIDDSICLSIFQCNITGTSTK